MGEIFTFRNRREERMMSTRAERLSDQAKQGSDSVGKLDSPSEQRSRNGKFFPRNGKCPSGQFLSLYTCMSPSGDSFFSIFRGCSNHKSTIIIAQQNLKRKISGDFFSNFFPLRDRSKMMPFLNSSIKA